jgi:hypothetical protein
LLAKQKLAASAPVRPSLNTLEPFASLNVRWAEMTRREDELTATLRPLVAEIRAAGGYAERGGVPVRSAAGPDGYRPGVAELVADLVPFERPAPRPLSEIDRKKARADKISAELVDITEAKKRLLPALNRARAEASAKVCDAVRAEYAEIAQRIAAALTELGEAWTAHLGFLRDLAADGVSTTTLPQMVLDVVDGRDPLAAIGRALNHAAECRYINPNAVPPEWVAR